MRGDVTVDDAWEITFSGGDDFDLSRCEVGQTGLLLEATGVTLDLEPAWNRPPRCWGPGSTPASWAWPCSPARVQLPEWLTSADGEPVSLTVTGGVIGSGGFGGRLTLDGGPLAARLFGFGFALRSADLTFVQNVVTAGAIEGALSLPFFEAEVGVSVGFGPGRRGAGGHHRTSRSTRRACSASPWGAGRGAAEQPAGGRGRGGAGDRDRGRARPGEPGRGQPAGGLPGRAASRRGRHGGGGGGRVDPAGPGSGGPLRLPAGGHRRHRGQRDARRAPLERLRLQRGPAPGGLLPRGRLRQWLPRPLRAGGIGPGLRGGRLRGRVRDRGRGGPGGLPEPGGAGVPGGHQAGAAGPRPGRRRQPDRGAHHGARPLHLRQGGAGRLPCPWASPWAAPAWPSTA